MWGARWAGRSSKSLSRIRIARSWKTRWRTWRRPLPTGSVQAARKPRLEARRSGCGSILFPMYRRRSPYRDRRAQRWEPKQILELARPIQEAGEVRAALNLAAEKYPRLAVPAAATADPRPILRDLRGKVPADGSVADDASVALNSVAPGHRTAAEGRFKPRSSGL